MNMQKQLAVMVALMAQLVVSGCLTTVPVRAYQPDRYLTTIDTFPDACFSIQAMFRGYGISVSEIEGPPRPHRYAPFSGGTIVAEDYVPKSSAPFGESELDIQSPNGVRLSFDRSVRYFGFTRTGNIIRPMPGLAIVARDSRGKVLARTATDPLPPQGDFSHVAESAQFIGVRSWRANIQTIEIVPQPPFEGVSIIYGYIDNLTFK